MTRKQLGLIDLGKPPSRAVHLKDLPDDSVNPQRKNITKWFVVDGYFVERRRLIVIATGEVILDNQFEMPLEGVPWVVESIEQQFERKPSDGGLPRDVFNVQRVVGGEHLQLRYGVSVGGEGVGGYTVHNYDRASYITALMAQEFSFTIDSWRANLREFFKELCERITAGEFAPPAV
jgi:hypothetical protein